MKDADVEIDVAKTDSWRWRLGRSFMVCLMPFGLAVGLSVLFIAAVMIAVFGTSANRPSPAAAGGGGLLETFAGIPPVAYLVERIGGPCVTVEVLVAPGQDPHIFQPTPRQVIELSRARLFFRVGLPFEDRLVERVAGGPAHFAIVDTAAGIVRLESPHPCPLPEGEGDDDEGPFDPHVWLSPPNLKTMAANVAAALCQADPRHAEVYSTNLAALQAELDALHLRIAQSLAPYRGQAFYVFHPAFGYFAEAYGLRQESVEVEGKPPTPRQVFALVAKARNDRVKIIFLQPQFNEQIAASIAQAIGGTVTPMDDLARDVPANLDDVAEKIAASNRGETK
jgi:zinc transport system substrate-binding protein